VAAGLLFSRLALLLTQERGADAFPVK
jgi:hypothetical protein